MYCMNSEMAQQYNDYGEWTVFNLATNNLSNVERASTQNVDQLSYDFNQLSLNEDFIFFPRCEYKTRFERTSAFRMSDACFWGTYFRSTSRGGNCDRIAAMYPKSKAYPDVPTNTPEKKKGKNTATKSGAMSNPFKHEEYKKIFKINDKQTDKNNDSSLYNQLLKYKKVICSAVVEEFKKIEIKKKINVYYENDYPCVMVQVLDFCKIKTEKSSLYSIVVAYFTAITNCISKYKKVPIELVNRASFGHNIPSVTEIGDSFRISIGIVPKIYAEVLVEALQNLNVFLAVLLEENCSFKLRESSMNQEGNEQSRNLEDLNNQIQGYNKRKTVIYEKKKKETKNAKKPAEVEKWALDDNLFDVLCKVGDSGSRKVSCQITRTNMYTDLLTDYVLTDLLMINEEESDKKYLDLPLHKKDLVEQLDKKDLARPLRKMLSKLNYSKEKVTLNVDEIDFNTKLTKFYDKECKKIAEDVPFWKLLENINLVFTKHDIRTLCEIIDKRKIIGLYSELEKANLEFIRNSGNQRSEDGYGSDSDCEFYDFKCETETSGNGTSKQVKRKFHSKKVILTTGMRAINFAHFLSIIIARTTKADTKYMYYETREAIKSVADIIESLKLDRTNSKQEQIRYIDLTHCANDEGPDSKVPELSPKENEEVIVLDYSSATTERIKEAIKRLGEVPVLLLVSSGLKNEQIGADMNPYGTIRIITHDQNMLNGLYFALIAFLDEKELLPKESHNIRKAYKDAGAVFKTAGLFSYKGECYLPTSITAHRWKLNLNPDDLKKIFNLFFNDMYKDELYNLTKIHNQDINEILHWSTEKIKCLGSSKVKDLEVIVHIDFRELIDEYNRDSKLAMEVIDAIEYENIRAFERGVKGVFDFIRKSPKEEEKQLLLSKMVPRQLSCMIATHLELRECDSD